jgi:hypothetical protein
VRPFDRLENAIVMAASWSHATFHHVPPFDPEQASSPPKVASVPLVGAISADA